MLLHLWWSFCQIIQSQGRDGSWEKDEEELDQLRRDSRDRSSCRHSNLKENIMASTFKTVPKEENWVKAVIFYINATYMNKYFVFCWVRRAVESESREVGKSLKIGKNLIKSEKSDLISYPTFWQKCQNAINCHKMPKCLHFGSGSCIRIS